MKLKDIEPGKAYTYVADSYNTTVEIVRVLSTTPYQCNPRVDHGVIPAPPGLKVGTRTPLGRFVGLLILMPNRFTNLPVDLSDSRWDGLTAEEVLSAELPAGTRLAVVRQQNLHPAEYRAELVRRQSAQREEERKQEVEAQQEKARRRDLAEQIARAAGVTDMGILYPHAGRIDTEVLVAIVAALRAPEQVLARAAERIRAQADRLRGEWGPGSYADPRRQVRLSGLAEAADLVDPQYGTSWLGEGGG